MKKKFSDTIAGKGSLCQATHVVSMLKLVRDSRCYVEGYENEIVDEAHARFFT